MAANPNSNLVFDFPDPTPRFEFGGESGKPSPASSPTKRKGVGKRAGGLAGKLSKKFSVGSTADADGSPSKASVGSYSQTGTATTASLGTSLNSSLGTPGGGNTPAWAASPPRNRKASPPVPVQQASSSFSPGSPDAAAGIPHLAGLSPSWSPKLALPTERPSHVRKPSSANSASGYVSEVSEQFSEFSFDRVTVTTNETGRTGLSSNVSWGFLDDAVGVAAVGGGQRDDGLDNKNHVATAAKKNGKGHRQHPSTGTFSNVSISDDEMDQIPMTGMMKESSPTRSGVVDQVSHSDQSVISEISERTGGALEGNSDARVQALLREGMDTVRQKEASETGAPEVTKKGKNKRVDSSPSRNTNSTAKSTLTGSGSEAGGSGSQARSILGDIRSNYATFKTSRNNGKKEKGTVLQSIIEGIEFCGLYFCGIDTTQDDELNPADEGYDERMRRRKEERRRDMDDNFLGKVVQCGRDIPGCGAFAEI